MKHILERLMKGLGKEIQELVINYGHGENKKKLLTLYRSKRKTNEHNGKPSQTAAGRKQVEG